MDIILGGMYQGKLEYAINKYNLNSSDIYYCEKNSTDIDLSKKIIYKFNLYIYALLKNNIDPVPYILNNINKYLDKVIVVEEIGSGVVPMDKMDRLYRDKVGVIMNNFAKSANSVVRIFCGLEEKLK